MWRVQSHGARRARLVRDNVVVGYADRDVAARIVAAMNAAETSQMADPGTPHIVSGEFQSDKYPTCPRGKVPLSTKDATAQDLLWEYAQRRRSVDAAFSADLELCLRSHGYTPSSAEPARLDGDRTAKPLTELRAVVDEPSGRDGATVVHQPVAYAYRDAEPARKAVCGTCAEHGLTMKQIHATCPECGCAP